MMKHTLYFGSPAYLALRNKQIEVRQPSEGEAKRPTQPSADHHHPWATECTSRE